MNARQKNQVITKLNAFIAPYRAEMRDGKMSIKNVRPGRTDGVTEWFQASVEDVERDIINGFSYRDDDGNGAWAIGEGFRAARANDLGNCSDPYTATTNEVVEHLTR